jgi:hypothetical protein
MALEPEQLAGEQFLNAERPVHEAPRIRRPARQPARSQLAPTAISADLFGREA